VQRILPFRRHYPNNLFLAFSPTTSSVDRSVDVTFARSWTTTMLSSSQFVGIEQKSRFQGDH
jgi:hypothetical protein